MGPKELVKIFESFGLSVRLPPESDESDDETVEYGPAFTIIDYHDDGVSSDQNQMVKISFSIDKFKQIINNTNNIPTLREGIESMVETTVTLIETTFLGWVCGVNPTSESMQQLVYWCAPLSNLYLLRENIKNAESSRREIDASWGKAISYYLRPDQRQNDLNKIDIVESRIYLANLFLGLIKTFLWMCFYKSYREGVLFKDITYLSDKFRVLRMLFCKDENGQRLISNMLGTLIGQGVPLALLAYVSSEYVDSMTEVLRGSGFTVTAGNINKLRSTVYTSAFASAFQTTFQNVFNGQMSLPSSQQAYLPFHRQFGDDCGDGICTSQEAFEELNSLIAFFLQEREWLTYESVAKTQKKKEYKSRHAYYSPNGIRNGAAEAFLDALNAWNNLSDNNHLSDNECDNKPCPATESIKVDGANGAIDKDEDLGMVKRMSNVSVAYGKSEGSGNNKKYTVVHWDPLNDPKITEATEVTDVDDTMRSIAWVKIRDGYVRLKRSKDNMKGWYYLLTYASALKSKQYRTVREDQNLLRFYRVKDSDGNFAFVPVLRHSPELTVWYYNKTGNTEDMKEFDEYAQIDEKLKPQNSLYGTVTDNNLTDSIKLMREVFHRDVLLEINDGTRSQPPAHQKTREQKKWSRKKENPFSPSWRIFEESFAKTTRT
jgi:hypothetical protein